MHPYTKHRQPAGSPLSSQYINASAMAATYAASSTLGDVPMATMEKQHTAVPMRQRLGHNCDARNTLDTHRCAYDDPREGARRGYHPRRGGRYDSGEDRSPSPGLPGP